VTEADRSIAREIAALETTLRTLRGKNGCPWDRAQSIDDIISYLIEESYELLQAAHSKDWSGVEEELGDVFFIVIFVHELLAERGGAPLAEIVSRAHAKIVNRHPHVFGGTTARTRLESVAEWERIKRSERPKARRGGLLDGVPKKLPPLRRAAALQRKAAEAGFDWPDHRGVVEKLREETDELERELSRGERERTKDELGDILFTVVNLARRLDVDPEGVLEGTTAKFTRRFASMERRAKRAGKRLSEMSLEEMERFWQESKRPNARRARGAARGRAASPRPRSTLRRPSVRRPGPR